MEGYSLEMVVLIYTVREFYFKYDDFKVDLQTD